MDLVTGVGLAGSIIGVIQLTGTLLTLTHGYIGAVRSAPKDIQELQQSLQEFSQFLQDLDNRVKKNPQLVSLTKLSGDDGPLERCSKELESLRLKLERPGKLKSFVWPLKEAEVSHFSTKLEGYKSSFTLALGLDHLSVSQDINSVVQSEAAEQAAWRQNEIDRRKKKDALRAEGEQGGSLNWLYPEPTGTRHLEISDMRQQETGNWFLKSREFGEFMEEKQDASLLWAHGIPGAGKTYISSLVIDYLKGRESTKWGVAYVYFNYKDQQQYKPSRVLASLVKQLACHVPQVPPKLEELHNTLKKEERGATFEELYAVLCVTMVPFSRVFLVFDALDECEPDDQRKLLPLFQRMKENGFNIFLTSRPLMDIQLSLAQAAKIEILANEEDIRLYVREKLHEHPQAKLLFRKAQCDDVTSDLIACTQGIPAHMVPGVDTSQLLLNTCRFLLVRFYIGDLVQQTSVSQIQTRLEELRRSTAAAKQGTGPLDFIYERAMKTIRGQHESRKDLAIKTLSWLMKAQRTLTFDELRIAVSVKHQKYEIDDLDLPDRAMLLDVCASLVMIDENTNTVRFVHYTAQEFLLKDSALLGDANFNVAMTCTTYLSFDVFAQGACISEETLKARIQMHPFFIYAAKYLSFHLGGCDESLSTGMVLEFLRRSGNVDSFRQAEHWRRYGYNRFKRPKYKTLLHIVACIGHSLVAELLLENGIDLWAVDDKKRTALHYAAKRGNEAVARVLIKRGKWMGGSVSCGAVGRDYQVAARLLVESGVNRDKSYRMARRRRQAAAWVLGGYISVYDVRRDTALHLAAKNGHEAVVRLMANEGADVSAKDQWGRAALHLAAEGGHKGMVQVLLASGANISARGGDRSTALHCAVFKGSEEIVQILIAEGADVSARNKWGDTALHRAALKGREKAVQLLIAGGADVSARNESGYTALHEAASKGREKVVQLLIAGGADVSARNKLGDTALHIAARGGSEKAVQLLIAGGADVSARNESGDTALHYVARGGSEKAVQLLIAGGADVSARNESGDTALHIAASKGSEKAVQLLIAGGADVSARNKWGDTALHIAASEGREKAVQLLIAGGADVSARNESGYTALHKAASKGREKVVQLLIAGGADVSARNKLGSTALHTAARGGSEKAVQLLIAGGADVSARNESGDTALHCAALREKEKVVQLLIAGGADVSAQNGDGRTALHHITISLGWWDSSERLAVARLLIEAGIGISARDKKGKTVLDILKENASEEALEVVKVIETALQSSKSRA